jgi:RPA family protein
VRSESDFEPNYAITELKSRVHRVKIVGTVRSQPIFGTQSSYGRFQLDDSTGTIWVSAFHTRVAMIERLAQGDLVQLVATVNEYRDALELIAESIAIVDPNFWLLHRSEVVRTVLEARREFEKAKSILVHERNVLEARETAREIGLDAGMIDSLEPEVEAEESEADLSEEILEVIGRLDAGGGVPLGEIKESLAGSHPGEEVEACVIDLMDEGEIYEPSMGKYAKI